MTTHSDPSLTQAGSSAASTRCLCMSIAGSFPLGASTTLAELARDPHPRLAPLRTHEPVSWLPELNGWLVTRRDLGPA